ncbi:MAG TPA: HAD family hydrolase [Bryobacteraceae bacterium]|nr:HAD family hydrolase [Bryobacteraceae bacterium]
MSSSLVLFDIDGTLTRGIGSHHRRALENAVRQVTGVPATTENIPVHGMLDSVILAMMMREAGIPDDDAARAMPAIIEAAQELYLEGVPDLRGKVCPGVADLLEELTRRGVVRALVTGNLTRIAWHKLSRAGLDHHFAFGAFGEMAPTRGELAKLAIAHARREGLIRADARISLIGDAITDVEAAHAAGIQAIAVRTGITPHEDLIAAKPHHLLVDLTCLDLTII